MNLLSLKDVNYSSSFIIISIKEFDNIYISNNVNIFHVDKVYKILILSVI